MSPCRVTDAQRCVYAFTQLRHWKCDLRESDGDAAVNEGVSLVIRRSGAGYVTLVHNGAVARLTDVLAEGRHSLETAHAHVAHAARARVLSATRIRRASREQD